MRKLIFVILLLLSSLHLSLAESSNFAKIKLTPGIPTELAHINQKFADPFYAVLNSHEIFQKVIVLWDSSIPENYWLYIKFKSNYTLNSSTNFSDNEGNLLITSSSFESNDEFKSRVLYNLKLDVESKELYYFWPNQIESNSELVGGIPQFIKPRLCRGKTMPSYKFVSIDGVVIDSEKLKGRFVFIDFWGTWCGGCKLELPNIVKMQKTFDEEDLFILGLALDEEETLKSYLYENPLNYPNAIVSQKFIDECEVNSFPTTVLINPLGIIESTGFWGEDLRKDVLKFIESYHSE